MAIYTNPDTARDYILASDRGEPPERQTIWKVKPLRARDSRVVGKELDEPTALGLCRRHLVGWENLVDESGAQIPFDVKEIDNLPPLWVLELASAIVGVDAKSEDDDLKN